MSDTKLAAAVGLGVLTVWLAIYGAIAFVAYHFISKLW